MVSFTGMFVFASFMLSLAVPSWAVAILNLGVNHAFQDYNVTTYNGSGNPIVGAPFISTFPLSQDWGAEVASRDTIRLLHTRPLVGGPSRTIGAHVDGLEGKALNAQDRGYGSAFRPEKPYGNNTEVYSFIFGYAYPELAITQLVRGKSASRSSSFWAPIG